MLHSIAVTTDFSLFSRKPFGAAAELARRFNAQLHLVHVVREPEIFTPWQVPTAAPEGVRVQQVAAQKRLEDLSASEPAFDKLKVRPQAILGEPARALCRFQEHEGIDLVVIASHGHTGADHFPLGSFAAKVLQLVSCPVLVFRHPEISGAEPWLTFNPDRILVPYDFSRASVTGLDVALGWAKDFEASMRLLFAVDAGDCDLRRGDKSFKDFFEEVRNEAQDQLGRLIRSECAGVQAEAVVRTGHPALEIHKEAEDYCADLVIMASRGRSALERLNLGSVGERMIHGAHCPVLLVKHSD